jgi:hypothetical protein
VLGRDGALFGTPVNSEGTTLPLTIGLTENEEFALIDQRKPGGGGVCTSRRGTTGTDHNGKPRRTLQVTGTGSSAALQGAVEYFCSALSMGGLKRQMGGFPANYQVVVKCTASGVRLMSYQYETHVVVDKAGR